MNPPIEMESQQNPTVMSSTAGMPPSSLGTSTMPSATTTAAGTGAGVGTSAGAQGMYIGPTGATTAPAGSSSMGPNKYRSDIVEEDYAPLRRWNLAFGIIHLVEGIAILILGAILARGPVPMDTNFSSFSSAGFVPGLQGRGYFHPGGYICIIFLVSALAHFIQYFTFRSWVNNTDKYRANRWRWFEYSISLGWMFYLVAMTIGMHEILLSLAFMGLVSCQMYLQLSMDLVNGNITHRGRTEWLPHIFAWVPFIYVLFILFSYQYNYPFRGVAPGTTYAVSMISIFFLLIYLIVQLAYFAKNIRSFVAYEKSYILLNAITKTVIGWLLFAFFVFLFYGIDGSTPTPQFT